jgi:hypothetical protein
LNLILKDTQNYYSYRKYRGCHWINRKYSFIQRRIRYYEEQQELTKSSAIHCPEPTLVRVDLLKNTKHKKSCTYIKISGREVDWSDGLKISQVIYSCQGNWN